MFPKMVGFPQQPWVFLLKMIILGWRLGVPPFKETPIYVLSMILMIFFLSMLFQSHIFDMLFFFWFSSMYVFCFCYYSRFLKLLVDHHLMIRILSLHRHPERLRLHVVCRTFAFVVCSTYTTNFSLHPNHLLLESILLISAFYYSTSYIISISVSHCIFSVSFQ